MKEITYLFAEAIRAQSFTARCCSSFLKTRNHPAQQDGQIGRISAPITPCLSSALGWPSAEKYVISFI